MLKLLVDILPLVGGLTLAAGGVYLGYLTLTHGWGWVLARKRALSAALEARAKAKAAALMAPFEARFRAIEGPLNLLKADVDRLKDKIGA